MSSGLSHQAATDGSHHTRSTADGRCERVDLPIQGMSCAACARRIELGLSKASGVRKASVNFATARATVEYDPHDTGVRQVIDRIRDVGYETASCSEQIRFPDFGIARDLPAFKTTSVEFTPEEPGEFTFTCGMNMMRGKLIVEAAQRQPGKPGSRMLRWTSRSGMSRSIYRLNRIGDSMTATPENTRRGFVRGATLATAGLVVGGGDRLRDRRSNPAGS